MNPKVLLVLVIILGVLFIVGTTSGVLRRNDQASLPTKLPTIISNVKSFVGNKLSGGQRLKAEDVDPPPTPSPAPECVNLFAPGGFTLIQNTSCAVSVVNSNKELRVLQLYLSNASSGSVASVVMQPPPTSEDIKGEYDLDEDDHKTPEREDCAGVQIFKSGGTIIISCPSFVKCNISTVTDKSTDLAKCEEIQTP